MRTRRICYFGTYREEYARNQILIEGLRRSGFEVIECHAKLWRGVEDRVQAASGGWVNPAFALRVLKAYTGLLKRYREIGDYDALIVGYPGHFDVYLAAFLTRWRRKPLVWDVLNSLYLITLERGIQKHSALTVEIIRRVERLACRLPDRMLLDTQQFIDWFAVTHRADPKRFRIVQIGADERSFQPLDTPPGRDAGFQVIYYGSYIPNHGVSTIVEAARLLEQREPDSQVRFEMVGDGPERARADALAKTYALKNITFIDWLERSELSKHIARSDVVLGAFGATQQLLLTNNNKIYEGFAMHKPVISARSPAMPEILVHGEHLYLCERGSPESLADAIQTLRDDPDLRMRLAENGSRLFHEHFDITHIGAQLVNHLNELLGGEKTE